MLQVLVGSSLKTATPLHETQATPTAATGNQATTAPHNMLSMGQYTLRTQLAVVLAASAQQ
jgi:hypothetical protein